MFFLLYLSFSVAFTSIEMVAQFDVIFLIFVSGKSMEGGDSKVDR